ncbi:unnamed protein product [Colias eurytheme]|nr:unnamed protein product [Colias eurytheme]
MDWMKLFALLVAVAFVSIQADGPKKKIRIHLPQKVKHIHHHKKIYITNHPASSQYAPAYMPSAEGSVAVPTSVLPGMSHIMPINDIYDDHQDRVPNLSSAASHLLPLYHARGYYGPTHTEIEEQEYDLSPSEPSDNFAPSGFSAPAVPIGSSHPPKRVKIIKLNEPPRKKVVKKSKPKRLPARRRPAPAAPLIEGEHPVSPFHEQFYSDVDGSATIRKVRKPPRVEKIIDGDTEHIHTYSEEHIHKVLFDGNSKIPNLVGVDPIAALPAYARPAPAYPFKGAQAIFAIPRHPFAGLAALGTMASPAHFEYAAYNPREVTHDHIYHDHGEIPSGLDITKDPMSLPPKVSYNGQGIRLSTLKNLAKAKAAKYKKPIKPVSNDYSYYEGIFTDNNRQKKIPRPSITPSGFEATAEEGSYRSLSDLTFKNSNTKPRNQVTYYGKSPNEFRSSSASSPFSVSSSVVHDYKPNNFVNSASAPGSSSKFKDPFANFKDNYANNFEYDTFASSSSNFFASEDKNDSGSFTLSPHKEKKKSVSTQNMSFRGKDHVTYINHLGSDPAMINDGTPTALDNLDLFDQPSSSNVVTPTPLTHKSSSPIHDIVSYLNSKSIQDQPISLPEASNNNFQYAEAPSQSTTPTSVATVPTQPNQYNHQNKDTTENQVSESRDAKNIREANIHPYSQNNNPTTVRGKLKYGDKL